MTATMNSTQLTALITDLISQPTESEWVEFKENFHSAEEIGERISALANSACLCSQNYGYLIFGYF
jgi:ATP-dependent DNA helicase RecG